MGGRGQIDDAAASIVAFALRQSGLEAKSRRRGDKVSGDGKTAAVTIDLICYASHPSDAVRRYTLRKLTLGGGARQARHLVIDYDVAPARAPSIAGAAGLGDTFAGDVATLCRLAAQHAVTVGHSLGLSDRPMMRDQMSNFLRAAGVYLLIGWDRQGRRYRRKLSE